MNPARGRTARFQDGTHGDYLGRDGTQLVFLKIETVGRRRIPPEKVEWVTP